MERAVTRDSNPVSDPRRCWRFVRIALLVGLVAFYGWFRYAALGMEQSRLPEAWAVPVTSDGETLMAFQQGDDDGRPVIFVHGTPGAADNWAYFLQGPRDGYRVIAVDRPGFGDSTPRAGLARLGEQAAALKPFLERHRDRRPILVGHSLGASIVAQAAVDYPDLVGGLVFVAGSLSPSVEKVFAIQYVGDMPGLRYVVPRVLRNSNRELIPLRQDLESLSPRLAAIGCPMAIVHGTADVLVPFENVAYMKAHLPADKIVEVIVLDGENHFLPWTNPEAIWRGVKSVAGEG